MEFSGRLTAFPPGELLQWAHSDGRTGALVMRRASREKKIWFQGGEVVGCSSDAPAESFGQYLLLSGYLSEDALNQALSHSAETGGQLGAALEELGLLTAETVRKAERTHLHELVCDLFLWDRGVFFFKAGRPPEAEVLPVPVSTLGLALEGSRWADEHRRIRRVLVHDEVVLRRSRATAAELGTLERWIVANVNGRRSLVEVYRAVGGSYFRFLSAALQLCVHEVLDIAKVPEQGPSGSRELSLADLALEEARPESLQPGGRRLQVPLEALEKLVPVVVGAPPKAGGVRELCARCDGTRRLAEVLGSDPEMGLSLFLTALRHGALALLPAPVDELDAVGRLAGALGGES